MAEYSVAVVVTAPGAGAAYCAFATGADEARINSIIFDNTSAPNPAGRHILVRPATNGTASASTAGQPLDPSDPAATAVVETAWSSAPTISTNVPLRRIYNQSQNFGSMVEMWPEEAPLVVPPNSKILLWNDDSLGGPAAIVTWCWEE